MRNPLAGDWARYRERSAVYFFVVFTFREHRKKVNTSGHGYGASTAPSQPLPRYWGCAPLEFLGIGPGTTGKVSQAASKSLHGPPDAR